MDAADLALCFSHGNLGLPDVASLLLMSFMKRGLSMGTDDYRPAYVGKKRPGWREHVVVEILRSNTVESRPL